MKIQYSKFTGFDWDSLSLEELLNKLSDFLLQSGFYSDYYGFQQMGQDHNLQSLHDAILDALLSQGMLSDELLEKLLGDSQEGQDSKLSQLVQALIQRLQEEGYISFSEAQSPETGAETMPGPAHEDMEIGQVKFELTDKSLDFLGYKTLKDLLGSLGKSSFGRHDTRDLSTGIEAGLLGLDVIGDCAGVYCFKCAADNFLLPGDHACGISCARLWKRFSPFETGSQRTFLLDSTHHH